MTGNEITTNELQGMLDRIQGMKCDLELGAVLNEIEAKFWPENEGKGVNSLNVVHRLSGCASPLRRFAA
jgi:hypothetical protein